MDSLIISKTDKNTKEKTNTSKVVAKKESGYYEDMKDKDLAFKGLYFEEAFGTSSLSKVADLISSLGDEEIVSRCEISPGLEFLKVYNKFHRKTYGVVLQRMTFNDFLSAPHRKIIVDEWDGVPWYLLV